MFHSRRAQAFSEYVMVVMIVAMAVSALMPMLRRGAQSMIKTGADQIGDQETAEQDFDSAYLKASNSTSSNASKMRTHVDSGHVQQITDEETNMFSSSALYMGSTED